MKNLTIINNRKWKFDSSIEEVHKEFNKLMKTRMNQRDGVIETIEIIAGNLGFEDNKEINRRRFTKEQGGSI